MARAGQAGGQRQIDVFGPKQGRCGAGVAELGARFIRRVRERLRQVGGWCALVDGPALNVLGASHGALPRPGGAGAWCLFFTHGRTARGGARASTGLRANQEGTAKRKSHTEASPCDGGNAADRPGAVSHAEGPPPARSATGFGGIGPNGKDLRLNWFAVRPAGSAK